MSVLIKNVTERQDIYILGYGDGHEYPLTDDQRLTFGITDDYTTLCVTNGKNKDRIETNGWVIVCTLDQIPLVEQSVTSDEVYSEHTGIDYETGKYDPTDAEDYAIILYNFLGEVRLGEIDDKTGKDYLHRYDILKDSYICDCYPDEYYSDSGYTETILILPENTEFKCMSMYDLFKEAKDAKDNNSESSHLG